MVKAHFTERDPIMDTLIVGVGMESKDRYSISPFIR